MTVLSFYLILVLNDRETMLSVLVWWLLALFSFKLVDHHIKELLLFCRSLSEYLQFWDFLTTWYMIYQLLKWRDLRYFFRGKNQKTLVQFIASCLKMICKSYTALTRQFVTHIFWNSNKEEFSNCFALKCNLRPFWMANATYSYCWAKHSSSSTRAMGNLISALRQCLGYNLVVIIV